MKKQLLLFILTLLPMLAMADASGSCGTNVTYTFDSSTGTLTIQGSGEMTSNPWSSYKNYIKTVIIKEGVTSIGNEAFYDCEGLTSVTIPNSLTSIGNGAFENCTGLTSITIPNGVTSIGYAAFIYCSSLTSVTIPNSVTSIGGYAFSGCSGLTSVTIPNSVTSIGNYAFSECSGLTSVTIGNSVTSIGDYAFAGCSSLTSVTIGNSVTSIGGYAFGGCSGLTSVNIPNSVTSIGQAAFIYCSGLTSVIIGNSVTSIGERAFFDCTGLQKVIVPDIAAWYGISFADNGANPLRYAHHIYSDENTEIKELVIPDGVTSIGSRAFEMCSGLTSVTIPNSVTSIGSSAFWGCSGLTSVIIGNSVTSIGSEAFSSCSSLQKVIVPDIAAWCGIRFADNSANPLYYAHHIYSDKNTEITEMVIPEGVNIIGQYAFYNCENITSVTIPSSVTSIGKNAFSCGIKLSTVNVNMNIPIEIDESVFEFTGKNYSKDIIYLAATLNVPIGSKNLYSNVNGWKKFANIQETEFTGVETIKQKSTPTSYYSVSGEKLNNVHHGINIIRMSDGTTRKVVLK